MKTIVRLSLLLLSGLFGIAGTQAQSPQICIVDNGSWNGNLERTLCGNALLRDPLQGRTEISGPQAAPSGSGGFMQPLPDVDDYRLLQRRSYESRPVSGTAFRRCLLGNRRMKTDKTAYDDACSDSLAAETGRLLQAQGYEVVFLSKADLARWYAETTGDKFHYAENRLRKSPMELYGRLAEHFLADAYLILTAAPWQAKLVSERNAKTPDAPVSGELALSFASEWDLYLPSDMSLHRLSVPSVSDRVQWTSATSEEELPNLPVLLSALTKQAASRATTYFLTQKR